MCCCSRWWCMGFSSKVFFRGRPYGCRNSFRRECATAAGFIFNAPRLISAIAPLIAGTLIVSLGGYGKAATIIGLFYILGLIAVPFLPETKGKPLPEGDALAVEETRERQPRTS